MCANLASLISVLLPAVLANDIEGSTVCSLVPAACNGTYTGESLTVPDYGDLCEDADYSCKESKKSNRAGVSYSAVKPPSRCSGTLPSELGLLTHLTQLIVRCGPGLFVDGVDNLMSGTIPTQLGKLSQLIELYLVLNQLTGTIPTQLGRLTALEIMDLQGNSLSGWLPTQLGQFSAFSSLGTAENRLSGFLPTGLELGRVKNRSTDTEESWLRLQKNRFSGTLPTQLGQLSLLNDEENFNSNELSGTLPSQLGMQTSLAGVFSVYSNRMSGFIPTELGKLTLSSVVLLDTNQLSGSIPIELDEISAFKSYCFNRLKSTLTNICPFGYKVGDCEGHTLLNASNISIVTMYATQHSQCSRCQFGDVVLFYLLSAAIAALFLILPLVARLLVNAKWTQFISPAISALQLLQFTCQIISAMGPIWPPSIMALFSVFNSLFSINLASLNTECALGIVLKPPSASGRVCFSILWPWVLIHVYLIEMTMQPYIRGCFRVFTGRSQRLDETPYIPAPASLVRAAADAGGSSLSAAYVVYQVNLRLCPPSPTAAYVSSIENALIHKKCLISKDRKYPPFYL